MPDNIDTSKMDQREILLMGFAGGNPSASIEMSEKRGQILLVNSALLPTDCGDRAAYAELGITLGEPLPDDPLFCEATLPDGWKKAPSESSMWSYLEDAKGHHRVAIFYKAAFYDRSAHMNIVYRFSIQTTDQNGRVYGDGPYQATICEGSWYATPRRVVHTTPPCESEKRAIACAEAYMEAFHPGWQDINQFDLEVPVTLVTKED